VQNAGGIVQKKVELRLLAAGSGIHMGEESFKTFTG
jgi:hypothetical protein